jgi:hypothetical protein
MKRICVFTFSLLLLAACSIQKRQHLKGYYVDWKSKPSLKRPVPKGFEKATRSEQPLIVRVPAQEPPLVAEAGSSYHGEVNVAPVSRVAVSLVTATTNCDILILRSGEEVSAKVSEITDDLVKYRRCDMPDGPTYSVKKNDVFMIKYSNGTKDRFEKKAEPVSFPEIKPKPASKTNWLALATFLIAIQFPLVLLAGAGIITIPVTVIVLALVAMHQINNSENQKGAGFAIAATVIAALTVLVGILILVALATFQ